MYVRMCPASAALSQCRPCSAELTASAAVQGIGRCQLPVIRASQLSSHGPTHWHSIPDSVLPLVPAIYDSPAVDAWGSAVFSLRCVWRCSDQIRAGSGENPEPLMDQQHAAHIYPVVCIAQHPQPGSRTFPVLRLAAGGSAIRQSSNSAIEFTQPSNCAAIFCPRHSP